jgi:hypothetical protein
MKLLIGLNLFVAFSIFVGIATVDWYKRYYMERAEAARVEQERNRETELQQAILIWRAEGREEAERDIIAGSMKIKIYGLMAGMGPEAEIHRRRMREHFGIEIEVVASCVVSSELMERSRAYNERIMEEITRKYGKDAFKNMNNDMNESVDD